jgi:hypothetical protein
MRRDRRSVGQKTKDKKGDPSLERAPTTGVAVACLEIVRGYMIRIAFPGGSCRLIRDEITEGRSMSDINAIVAEPTYGEHFAAFIDFLGFSEASSGIDEATRVKVLELLVSLASLRSEFHAAVTDHPDGSKQHLITPAISTFSDHILVSYPLEQLATKAGMDEGSVPMLLLLQLQSLIAAVAARALRLGFLVRGGATIGKLYHANGVAFGEAMVEASQLEAQLAIYPRVVLSKQITGRPGWVANPLAISKDQDGIYHLDYCRMMFARAATPGNNYLAEVKTWWDSVIPVIERNLRDLEHTGKLKELAKWTWFAKNFAQTMRSKNPRILQSAGVSLAALSWL